MQQLQGFRLLLLFPTMKENHMIIETPRLLLRRFTLDDDEAMLQLLGDEEVNRFLPWFPIKTLEQARAFIQRNFVLSAGLHCAICLKGSDRAIGYVNLGADDGCDIGYGLLRAHWGEGIATEAARAVIERAKDAGHCYITATHDVNNPASGKVMQKLGMTYRYSYVEQWQPKDIPVTFRMYQLNLDGDCGRVYKKYWDKYPRHFIEEI